MLPLPKTTRRKFYNKWFYKTTLLVPGSSIFRIYSHSQIREIYAKGEGFPRMEYSVFKRKSWENIDLVIRIIDFLSQQKKENYFIRLERDAIDFYTNDINFYDQINNAFTDIIKHRFEPDENSLKTLTEEPIIIVKKLPKDRYNYRAYLKPHMLKGDKESKVSYLKFLDGQSPAVSISESVKSWFMNTDWNWDRRYILVEDERTLLMLKLRNPEVLGKVYRFAVAINTECQ